MKILLHFLCLLTLIDTSLAQQPAPSKPRILVSTDIGGTDPDDNQSMIHLLMYSDLFRIEGLVSSPSYGSGSKEEILRMIDIYEKDFPQLSKYYKELSPAEYLRSITKQGKRGLAPFKGYQESTEGSNWIIKCAHQNENSPLWILVWGGLDDVAQALHDDPSIEDKIKIYWIGGPNKKWSTNSYAYIAANFPNLWFIEVNSSYYGFFSDNQEPDRVKSTSYYNHYIKGAGHLGKDFKNYYNGEIKMGDTPSLLYMMDGDPNDPTRESWGGSFEKIGHSSRVIYNAPTSLKDTVAFCTVLEFRFEGPESNISPDSSCFIMEVPYGNSVQKWPGYYLGNGKYGIRYVPKKAEILKYTFTSPIPELNGLNGSIVVENKWPGPVKQDSYPLGANWYSDQSAPKYYDGKLQGGLTIQKWRTEVLVDWARRWKVLRK